MSKVAPIKNLNFEVLVIFIHSLIMTFSALSLSVLFDRLFVSGSTFLEILQRFFPENIVSQKASKSTQLGILNPGIEL